MRRSLWDFIKLRWAHLGEGPISALRNRGGPDPKTAEKIATDPRRDLERNNDKQNQLVAALRFETWEELDAAWKKDDVLAGIGVVLTPGAFEEAKRAAAAKKIELDEWVNRAILQQAAAERTGQPTPPSAGTHRTR